MKDIMSKYEVFFGIDGLTSTSANHIANLAKEYVKDKQIQLDKISFVRTDLSIIGNSCQTVIAKGWESVSDIPKLLYEIEGATSLIAWLREAIKAKATLGALINGLDKEDYCEIMGQEYPKAPTQKHVLTEEEYYESLPIKERNRYYQLETRCSVLGKFIHPNGGYAQAREFLSEKLANPNSVKESGRDTLIYHYEPTISIDRVDEMFFSLQKEHREAQAALNSIKYACEKAIDESRTESDAQYEADYSQYTQELVQISNALKVYKNKMKRQLNDKKIIIPNSLQNIYHKIASLGK